MSITAEERALARASIYRLLGIAFSYPAAETVSELHHAGEVAVVGADLISEPVAEAVAGVLQVVRDLSQPELEASYQRTFTLSYSEDCPLHETAFSARHIFQQTQQQADIAGFYRAFGVDSQAERSDHLALELEFLYLLALKEATARERRERGNTTVCRSAQRSFMKDHVARWVPLIGKRIAVVGSGGFYSSAARLLVAFISWEERFLRLGRVELFRDEPVLIADEPGDMSCPMLGEGAVRITASEDEKDIHLALPRIS